MKYKIGLATLVLSCSLMSAVGLSHSAFAHDGMGGDHYSMSHEHQPLSKEQKDLLRSTMKKTYEQNKAAYQEMRELKKQQLEILKDQNFDKAKFVTLSQQIEQKKDQMSDSRMQAFADIADKFSPQQREHLLWKMKHHHHGHHHHWGHHKDWNKSEVQSGEHKQWDHREGSDQGVNSLPATAPENAPSDTSPPAP
jgi:uncharacterized membrane protein